MHDNIEYRDARDKILKCSEDSIRVASKYIKKGGVIIYPTDTVYGLGADPYNKAAVNKVFSIKGRDRSKQLPLLASSIDHINGIAEMSNDAKKLASRFWPGALTIIIRLRDEQLIDILDTQKVGVRIPDNRCALSLIDACNGILIGTSANISGYKSVKDVRELDNRLLERVDLIIDDGITLGIESTVIDVMAKKIIREGYIKKEQIEEVLGYEL